MRRPLAALLFLSACASAPQPGVPSQHAATINNWFYWSAGNFQGLSRPNGGLVAFDFPIGDPAINHVDYVTQSHSGPLTTDISVTYTVTGTADLEPNTSGFKCPCGTAVVHLFIGQRGYNPYNYDISEMTKRWWSTATTDLSPGIHTMTLSLQPGGWIDVDGKLGDTAPVGFAAALADVGSVGITFGASQGPAGHGVAAVTGGATLVINSLTAT